MVSKPIIRWTLGNVSNEGFDVLLKSIFYWKKNYKDLFFTIVCYNEANPEHIIELKKNEVNLFDQIKEYKNYSEKYLWKPALCGWKLYPARLNLNSHEIFCDNDIIITKKLHIIDEFLNSDMVFSCSAIKRCFGNFDGLIPQGLKFNNGFFGVPPLFDLESKVKEIQIKSQMNGWYDFFDEQGLISSIFLKHKNFKTISMNEVYNCFKNFKYCDGMHFCGINKGHDKYWRMYKKITMPKLYA